MTLLFYITCYNFLSFHHRIFYIEIRYIIIMSIGIMCLYVIVQQASFFENSLTPKTMFFAPK